MNKKIKKPSMEDEQEDDEDDEFEEEQKDLDFYGEKKRKIDGKKKSQGGNVDQTDFNLGKNTKMVLDFTTQEEETKQVERKKSGSPMPPQHRNPNAVK